MSVREETSMLSLSLYTVFESSIFRIAAYEPFLNGRFPLYLHNGGHSPVSICILLGWPSAPPPNAEFGPRNGALGPRNH